MGREIKVFSFCDPCEREGVNSEGTEYTITLNKMTPRLLVVCEVHEKEITALRDLIEPLQKADDPVGPGRPNKAQGAVGNRINCEVEDCNRDYKNLGSLRRHVTRDHGYATIGEYTDATGHSLMDQDTAAASPADSGADEQLDFDDEDYEVPDEFKCQHCDVFYDPRRYKMPKQAIGMHVRRAHGIGKDGEKIKG